MFIHMEKESHKKNPQIMVDKSLTAETFQMAQVVNKTGAHKSKHLLFIWLRMKGESFVHQISSP